MDDAQRLTLAEQFSALGIEVSVRADASLVLSERAASELLIALARTAAVRSAAFDVDLSLDEVLSAEGPAVTLADAGFVALVDSVVVPANAVLSTLIELDLSVRVDALDDLEPAEAVEELRFLFTAAERCDVVELGEYVGVAAQLLAGSLVSS